MEKGLIEIKDKLSKELAEYARIKDITNANLDVIYKTVKSIYYLTTMEAMDDYSKDSYRSMDYSGRYGSYDGRAGRDGDSDGRYSERRSMDGSYESYGYSRHDPKDHLMNEMKRMMMDLQPREQQAVKECIERMQ